MPHLNVTSCSFCAVLRLVLFTSSSGKTITSHSFTLIKYSEKNIVCFNLFIYVEFKFKLTILRGIVTTLVHNISIVCLVLPFCSSAARMCRCDIICWDMAFSPPPCPILKSVRHTLQKVWRCLHGFETRHSSVQLLLNFHKYLFFAGAPPDSPSISTTDDPTPSASTTCVHYLRRSPQRAMQVARLRSEMVRNLCRLCEVTRFKIWQLDNLGI